MSVLERIDFLGNTPRRKAIHIGKHDFIDLFHEVKQKQCYSAGLSSYDLFFEAEGKFYQQIKRRPVEQKGLAKIKK